MITGVNHITWNVVDIEETFTFYVDLLGLTPVMKSDRSAYFLAGNIWLAVIKGPARSDNRYDHVAFQVTPGRYRQVVARLIDHGVTQWQPNQTQGDSFYFTDPSGNKFELHAADLRSRIDYGKQNWGDSATWYL